MLLFEVFLTEHTMVKHFTLYSYILDYYVNLEPIKLPVEIMQKIVRDSTAILEKMSTMTHLDILGDRRVNEVYVNNMIEFVFRNSEQVNKHTFARNLKVIWKMYR